MKFLKFSLYLKLSLSGPTDIILVFMLAGSLIYLVLFFFLYFNAYLSLSTDISLVIDNRQRV